MPAWITAVLKLFGSLLAEKLVEIVKEYVKEEYDKYKTKQEIKRNVEKLRASKTEAEIRSAIRNLLP